MKVLEIVTEGEGRLRGSTTAASSLEFFFLLATLASSLGAALLPELFRLSPLLRPWGRAAEAGMLLLCLLLLLNPIRLGTARWYCRIREGFLPAREAFAPLSGLGWWKAVWFGLVRSAVLFLCGFLPLVPSLTLFAVLRTALRGGRAEGGSYAMLLVMFCLLVLLGTAFAIFLSMGLFFTEYFYAARITENPFRAIAASWQLALGNRGRLFKVLFCTLPYFLLCLLVAPIPFASAKIRSIFTAFAVDTMENGGYQCHY